MLKRCEKRKDEMNSKIFGWMWAPLFVAVASAEPTTRPGRVVNSPEVSADHKVTFRIVAAKAADVSVGGDFGAGQKLTKGEEGLWSVTVGPLTPDLYSYSFTIDGVKTIDSRNPNTKPGIAGLDNTVFVAGDESKFEDNLPVPHGQIRQVWYQSRTLQMQRRMHVYTPPGYDGTAERFPVLYLLHGGGDEDAGWSTIGRAGFILDNLIATGKARPMIVVMPNGSIPRPAGGREPMPDRFTDELLKEVIPQVEQNFKVIADPEHRALAGLSMGGGQTLRAVTANPEMFAYVGVWSAGIGNNAGDWEQRNQKFLDSTEQLNKSIRLFSISVGDKDFTMAGSKSLDEILSKYKIKHELHISGGGHTWINWRHYLNELGPRLFQ